MAVAGTSTKPVKIPPLEKYYILCGQSSNCFLCCQSILFLLPCRAGVNPFASRITSVSLKSAKMVKIIIGLQYCEASLQALLLIHKSVVQRGFRPIGMYVGSCRVLVLSSVCNNAHLDILYRKKEKFKFLPWP